MENRKPFNIDKLLLYYNVTQVVLNFSLFAYVSGISIAMPHYFIQFKLKFKVQWQKEKKNEEFF